MCQKANRDFVLATKFLAKIALAFFMEENMACFTVPLAEAVVVSVVKAVALKKGNANEKVRVAREKLSTLEKMLYGGSALLAVEHFYHGEISFVPPFLTAMNTPEEIPVMLHEIATVGVGMALLVTAAWGIGCAISHFVKKHSASAKTNPRGAATA